jgi:Ca2+-binding RTX toxin-like protein
MTASGNADGTHVGGTIGAMGNGAATAAGKATFKEFTVTKKTDTSASADAAGPNFFNGRLLTADDLARDTAGARGELVNEFVAQDKYLAVADDVIVDGGIITAENWPAAGDTAVGAAQRSRVTSLTVTFDAAEAGGGGGGAGKVSWSDSGGITKAAPVAAGEFPYIISFQDTASSSRTAPVKDNIIESRVGGLVAPLAPSADSDLGTTVEGTNGNDIMFQTSAWWETLLGLGGNDVFVATASKETPAADTWDGGAGTNTAYFGSADTPVIVNLANGNATRDFGGYSVGGIDLINIQDVVGSAQGDQITGDAVANTLWGHDGNDLLIGGAGNDTLDGGQDNDVLRGGAGVDVIRGESGADAIRWHVGDLGRDEIEGFVLGADSIGFGDGFLVTADPADSLFVTGSFNDSILMADTIEAGWQEIARFQGISDDDLVAAINNGILFSYEAGPLQDDAPGGLAGPARPDLGQGGGTVAGVGQFPYQASLRPGAAERDGGLIYAGESGELGGGAAASTSPAASGLDDYALITDFSVQAAASGGAQVLLGDGSVRFLRDSVDLGDWSPGLADASDPAEMAANNLKQLGLALHNYDSGVF